MEPLDTNFSEIVIEIDTFFIHENSFENFVCEMAVILSRPQSVTNGQVRLGGLDRNSFFCAYNFEFD